MEEQTNRKIAVKIEHSPGLLEGLPGESNLRKAKLPGRWLKIRFKGNTLIEVVTASIIFMIVFTMTMDILTRLSAFGNNRVSHVIMERDLKTEAESIKANGIPDGDKVHDYEWGEIQIGISEYKDNLCRIDMQAVSGKGKIKMYYTFLAQNKDGHE